MAKEIITLNTGEHFGINRKAENHCGSETLVVQRYDAAAGGFRVGFISSEGVVGQYQPLRFRTEEDARHFIEEQDIQDDISDAENPYYRRVWGPNGYPRAIRGRGTQEFIKIPLANSEMEGYVKIQKFNGQWDRFARECPEYFDEEAPAHEEQSRYRGFRFD